METSIQVWRNSHQNGKKKKAWCGQVYMDIKLPKREEIFEMVKCTLHIGGIKREV